MQSTWETRDLPLLEAVAEGEAEDAFIVNEWLAERTGMSPTEVARGVDALLDAGYVRVGKLANALGEGTSSYYMDVRLSVRGRREVGMWPAEGGVELLLQVINARINTEDDPDAKGALAKLRDDLAGMPIAIATALLTDWMKRRTGLG